MSVIMASMLAVPGYGITCPEGSKRAGSNVSSLAECNIEATEGDNGLMNVVGKIIGVIIPVLGVVAVIVVIYGGFLFMTSTGDSNKVQKAKSTILYGLIGLIIAVLAYAIVNFVLDGVFG